MTRPSFLLVILLALFSSAILAPAALADTPALVSFSAYVTEDDDGDPSTPEVPVDGTRDYRFAIFDDAIAVDVSNRVWWEEQTVDVVDGQLQVQLGVVSISGGSTSGSLDASAFGDADRWLDIREIGSGVSMAPRIQFTSNPYAFRVQSVDGAEGGTIQGTIYLEGDLEVERLRVLNGAVDGHVLTSDANGNATWQAPSAADGGEADYATGRFDVQSADENGISLFGNKSDFVLPKTPIVTGLGARIEMFNINHPGELRALLASGGSTGGGSLELHDNGSIEVFDEADNHLFELLPQAAANEQPVMRLSDGDGDAAFRWRAASNALNDRPEFSVLDGGKEFVELVADHVNHGTHLYLRQDDGAGGTYDAIAMETGVSDGGATIWLRDRNGDTTMILDADQDSDPGNARIRLQSGGSDTITLSSADGRVKTKILEITGGSDLSEQFDVRGSAEPGTVVSIDAENPGELRVSDRAYDRTVAGIVSGAGGVQTGMIMGQKGSIADGQHPIALTGRVYVKADASRGSIRPGDLLTTADRAGHAMKVDDHGRATGAILGKAMTGLDAGQGLVLVLVGLQ